MNTLVKLTDGRLLSAVAGCVFTVAARRVMDLHEVRMSDAFWDKEWVDCFRGEVMDPSDEWSLGTVKEAEGLYCEVLYLRGEVDIAAPAVSAGWTSLMAWAKAKTAAKAVVVKTPAKQAGFVSVKLLLLIAVTVGSFAASTAFEVVGTAMQLVATTR